MLEGTILPVEWLFYSTVMLQWPLIMPYIINATNSLVNDANRKTIANIGHDLALIKRANPKISQIIVRGGCVLDSLLGIEPNDVDLFYSYEPSSGDAACICDEIRLSLKGLKFKFFVGKDIDLENSLEKEPALQPIERTVGSFTYHTEYNSQFAIDCDGAVWTNIETLEFYRKEVYEIRFDGYLPWAYFPRPTDLHDYFAFQSCMLIRGIGYMVKRDLTPGSNFMNLFAESEYLLGKAIERVGDEDLKRFARNKIKSRQNLDGFLRRFVEAKNIDKFTNLYGSLLDNQSLPVRRKK